MRTKIFKLVLLSILTVGTFATTSCVDETLNDDPKHASVLPSENLLAMGLQNFAYYAINPSVNGNNYNFFVQQWTETTYTDETNYNLVTRNQPRTHFNRMYVYSIGNLKKAEQILESEGYATAEYANKKASLEIMEVLVWENIVNTFGNVPYSEAFLADTDRNFNPKYDDAKTIYIDLIARLDAAIASIDTSSHGYLKGDFVYHGNMDKWKKTANAIKLRLGINLADTDAALAKSTIESAYQSGVYNSEDDAFIFNFDGGTFTNPVFDNLVASGRNDFVPAENFINLMKEKLDPRLDVWFTKVNGEYIGGVFGTINGFATKSHLSNYFLGASAPANLVSYSEVSFILAEAAARGFAVGSAQEHYNNAITANMTESGVDQASILTYLAANPYNAAEWKKSIGEQAWLSTFNRGYQAWNFTRRLDYPVLINPANSQLESVPVRMPYSDQEYVLNRTNVEAAATAIGGDKATTKLFWDKF